MLTAWWPWRSENSSVNLVEHRWQCYWDIFTSLWKSRTHCRTWVMFILVGSVSVIVLLLLVLFQKLKEDWVPVFVTSVTLIGPWVWLATIVTHSPNPPKKLPEIFRVVNKKKFTTCYNYCNMRYRRENLSMTYQYYCWLVFITELSSFSVMYTADLVLGIHKMKLFFYRLFMFT